MRKLSWLVGLAVFAVFFGVYSYRLGIEPAFWHDDYEYTYPSFSLAERGDFGSPLLGTAFNIQNRTYHFTIYYYATVHAVLIRIFGERPRVDPARQCLSLCAAGGGGGVLSASSRRSPGPVRLSLRADERRADGHGCTPGTPGDDRRLLPHDGRARTLALVRRGHSPAGSRCSG